MNMTEIELTGRNVKNYRNTYIWEIFRRMSMQFDIDTLRECVYGKFCCHVEVAATWRICDSVTIHTTTK